MHHSPVEIPLQITFRNMEPSPAVEARLREKAAKLQRLYGKITACRVVVEAPHEPHKGRSFKVSIDLSAPGREILVSKGVGDDHAHEDVYVAIRDAFDAASRKLDDTGRRRRGDVKHHEPHERD